MRNAYVKAVGALLECPRRERERLLARLDGAVSAYLEDHPQATPAELAEGFGAPEVCAASLLAECDPQTVARLRRSRRVRIRVLTAALVLLAVLALLGVAYTLHQGYWSLESGAASGVADLPGIYIYRLP